MDTRTNVTAPAATRHTTLGGAAAAGGRPSVRATFDPATAPPAPSQRTLTLVELRKMTDTRSGRWVLAVIGLSMIGMTCLVVFAGDAGDRTSTEIFLASQAGMSVLLPVLGILAITAEWTQRTGHTTFALVPRRGRVVQAKVQAGILLAAAFLLTSGLVTIGGHALGLATDRADGGWSVPADLVATRALDCVIAVLCGIAFGMLLSSPLLAILSYYAIPIVFGILAATVSAVDAPLGWINLGETLAPLSEEGTVTGNEWARIAASVGLFTVLPFAAGTWRTLRREIG